MSSSNVGAGVKITWKAVKNDPSWGNIKSYRVIYHDNSAVNFENWYYNVRYLLLLFFINFYSIL